MDHVGNEELQAGPAWKVRGVQTGRGFGARTGSDGVPEDLISLTLICEDLDKPGYFVFAPEDAEKTALALLDTVRRYRESREDR